MKPEDSKTKDEVQKDLWQFSGDGKKPPITIEASSREEAEKLYNEYLTS